MRAYLVWAQRYAEKEAWFLALQAEQGTPLPEPYRNRPQLDVHLVGVWALFCSMNAAHPQGIPESEILAHCDGFGIGGEVRADLVALVRRLDIDCRTNAAKGAK